MLKLGFLAILLFGLSCAADEKGEDQLKVYLLNKDGIQNSSLTYAEGLVLAIGGRVVAGFEYKASSRYTRPRADELCRMMGFDMYVFATGASYRSNFSRSELDEIPYIIQMSSVPYTADGYFSLRKQYNSTEFLYMKCYKAKPAPVKQISFELVARKGDTFSSDEGEGIVVAIVVTNDNWDDMEYGTVCDDNVTMAAAHMICKQKGYPGATNFTSNSNYHYMPEDYIKGDVILDDLACRRNASNITDCTYNLYDHDCSHTEDLIVFCDKGDKNDTWDIHNANLWSYRNGAFSKSNPGVLGVELKNEDSNRYRAGTVCDDGFSDASADVACKLAGYDYVDYWTNNGRANYSFIPKNVIGNLSIVIDEMRCKNDSDSIEDCSYKVLQHDCSHAEDVILKCGKKDEKNETWEFTQGALFQYDNKSDKIDKTQNEGVLLVEVQKTSSSGRRSSLFGTVCASYANSKLADLTCQMLGYDKSDMYGRHFNFQYIPARIMEKVNTVVYDVRCPSDAETVYDCSYKVGTNNSCTHKQDMVFRCQGGDVEPTSFPTPVPVSSEFPTPGPCPFSTSPMQDEVKLEFGGAELQVKVGPKKISAKLSDILEDLFG